MTSQQLRVGTRCAELLRGAEFRRLVMPEQGNRFKLGLVGGAVVRAKQQLAGWENYAYVSLRSACIAAIADLQGKLLRRDCLVLGFRGFC